MGLFTIYALFFILRLFAFFFLRRFGLGFVLLGVAVGHGDLAGGALDGAVASSTS